MISEWGFNDGAAFIPFSWIDDTVEATTTYVVMRSAPSHYRVLNARVTMQAAGAASDTIVIQRVRAGTTAAISDTINLSGFADKEIVDFSELDDATCDLQPGDTLQVTTAGATSTTNPQCRVVIDLALKVGGTV
jgi:SpoU rRNA methylase family enzyme